MRYHTDQSGKRFGRWTVLKRIKEGKGKKRPYYLCRCDCGKEIIVKYQILKTGQSKSCGCYRKDKIIASNTTHGMYYTSEHATWATMHDRCQNPKSISYKWYGGRGIKICEKWDKKNPMGFINFFNDMKQRPSKEYSLDRIDNNKDYSPDNCRWATRAEQAENTSKNVVVEYKNEKMCVSQLSKKLNVSHGSLLNRLIHYNFNIEALLNSYKSHPYKFRKHSTHNEVNEIIKIHNSGIGVAKIARIYHKPYSTIYSMIRNRKKK